MDTHEKIESDDTDLTITVGSSGDINIGANIGLTFGDDGEKIEGDGTDLTIASSNLLNLTATTDVSFQLTLDYISRMLTRRSKSNGQT